MGDAGGVCVYGGVGEVRRGDGVRVGEELDGEHVTDGGESVCCVIEDGCGCCSPLVSGAALDGELWTGLVWMESDFKEDEEDDETEEGVKDAEWGTVFGMGGDCTTSS